MRGGWLFLAFGVLAPVAAADPDADEQFRTGRDLVAAGQLPEACAAFAASQQARPRVATLLNLADCQERLGEYARAHATFVEARSLAIQRRDSRREAEASRRILALEPRLPPPVVVAESPELTLPTLDAAEVQPAVTSVAAAPSPRSHTFGIGGFIGMNVRHESLLGGLRVVGSLEMPGGALRAIGAVQFSRYNDEPSMPTYLTDTLSLGGSVDYLWVPRPTFAIGAGLGIGADYDFVTPTIVSPDPDLERVSDLGTFFMVRLTPIALRLHGGAVEVGMHLVMQVAADEVTYRALFAMDWFLW